MSTYLIIKKIAQRKNITQKDIAVAFGVTENQMTNYLTGRTKILADHIPIYARVLRVPITSLFNQNEDLLTLEEPIGEYLKKECELCKSKDLTIATYQDMINLLKVQIEMLTK